MGGRAGDLDRNDQHRRRSERLAATTEQLAGTGAIEQHAQPGDVALVADLLLLDDDAGDNGAERTVTERGRARTAAVHLRPKHRPALTLRDPPCGLSRLLGILGDDIDIDAANLIAA